MIRSVSFKLLNHTLSYFTGWGRHMFVFTLKKSQTKRIWERMLEVIQDRGNSSERSDISLE
jgi:hypothetical protein